MEPTGKFTRPQLPEGTFAFNCHRFFMENPSLSGRGSAGADDAPILAKHVAMAAPKTTPPKVSSG
jgi:polyphosphate kinase